MRSGREIGVVCLLLVGAAFGCALQKEDISTFPSSEERAAGAQLNLLIRQKVGDFRGIEESFRAQGIFTHLVESAFSLAPWHLTLLNCSDFNAFSTVGNFIYLCSGVFSEVKNDNELAAVIAHEIGHEMKGHNRNIPRAQRQALMKQGFGAGVMPALSIDLLFASRSQLQERDADEYGLILMADAGFDPRSALEMWERVVQSGKVITASTLQTHPGGQKRIEELRALLPEALSRYEQLKTKI